MAARCVHVGSGGPSPERGGRRPSAAAGGRRIRDARARGGTRCDVGASRHRGLPSTRRVVGVAVRAPGDRGEVTASGLRQFGHIAIVFAGNSLALAHAGAVEPSRRASEHVEHLLSTLDTVHQRSHIQHHLILAEAALIRGERATALRLLRYAQNRLPREPDAVVLHRWAERIALRCSSDDGLPTVDLTPAEHRVLDSRSDELDRVSDGRGGRRGDPGGG